MISCITLQHIRGNKSIRLRQLTKSFLLIDNNQNGIKRKDAAIKKTKKKFDQTIPGRLGIRHLVEVTTAPKYVLFKKSRPYVGQMYHIELEIKDTKDRNAFAFYLDF